MALENSYLYKSTGPGIPASYYGRTGPVTGSTATSIGTNLRAPVSGSTNYTNPYTYAAGRTPTATSYASTGTTRPVASGAGSYQGPSPQLPSNYNPTSQPPSGGMPPGVQTPTLSSMVNYWNQYAPANQQGSSFQNYGINPDGTVTYSFANAPGQQYTKSPQDFNAMVKTMGTYTNQTTGGAVPLYTGQYNPTNVQGQYYGGSSSGWSPSAYSAGHQAPAMPNYQNYTQTGVQSPYGAQGQGQGGGMQSAMGGTNPMMSFINYMMSMGRQPNYGSMGYGMPQYVGVGGNQSRYPGQNEGGYNPYAGYSYGGSPNYYGY